MSDVKFCRDCAHFRGDAKYRNFLSGKTQTGFYEFGRCAMALKKAQLDFVSGELKGADRFGFADLTRGHEDKCGPDARWFQPIIPEE